jgi:MFS family permease
MSTNVWLTAFAKYVLAKGNMDYEFLYNYLIMFMGVGSFIGAMVIASMSRGGPHKVILKIYPYFIGGMLIVISFANSFLLTGLGMALLGFCFVSFTSTANSTVQYNTEDQYRGRVMSVYSLLSGGASPLGNLYAGAITQNIGARAGFRGSGLLILSLLAISRFLWAKTSRNKAEIVEQSAM